RSYQKRLPELFHGFGVLPHVVADKPAPLSHFRALQPGSTTDRIGKVELFPRLGPVTEFNIKVRQGEVRLEVGTLAKLTLKQPARPRHQVVQSSIDFSRLLCIRICPLPAENGPPDPCVRVAVLTFYNPLI